MIHQKTLFINGEWAQPSSGNTIQVVSASTEEIIGSVPEAREPDVDAAVDAARKAADDPHSWASWPLTDRADALERFADALERRADQIARQVSAQNGMPVAISTPLEGGFPPALLRYYAGLIREATFDDERPALFGGTTVVRREPIGVIGVIVPWNFPQTLAASKYAPALAAGCTVVVKQAPETVLDAIPVAEAATEAGIPPGVINFVPGGRDIGAYLVSHPLIDKISFTGSTMAGRAIGETCGRLLRPVSLELGGKSAAIILDDAELDLAKIGQDLFKATLLNQGQTCYLGTRVLAPRSRYRQVVDVFAALVGSLGVGNALEPTTLIGPLVSARQRDRVEGYIAKGEAEGARLVVGGGRPTDQDRGWFVEPTIFADVDNNHTIAQEEIFGPVLSVIPYTNDADAVRIANDSDYGLGGSVWSPDLDRALDVAQRVHTGTIGINRYQPDAGAPFGGVKSSGLGREFGPEAIGHYQQTKSIYR